MKRITLLNGINEDSTGFEGNLKKMIERQNDQFVFDLFNLRDMPIHYCCGCWSCWVKTPGECSQKDDMPIILKSILSSDLTLFISPIVMGFVSPLIKKINDKMIPLVHPYIELVHGECHHKKRYSHYPKLGLVLVDQNIEELAGLELITDSYQRLALNLKSAIAFVNYSAGSVEGMENEIKRFSRIAQG